MPNYLPCQLYNFIFHLGVNQRIHKQLKGITLLRFLLAVFLVFSDSLWLPLFTFLARNLGLYLSHSAVYFLLLCPPQAKQQETREGKTAKRFYLISWNLSSSDCRRFPSFRILGTCLLWALVATGLLGVRGMRE